MSIENKLPDTLPANIDECESLMERLSGDCNRVRDQLEAAAARKYDTGQYADSQWYRRASSALRWMSRDRQRLQVHMGKLRRAAGIDHDRIRDKLLIAALRDHVSPEVFQVCTERAGAEAAGGGL